MKIIELNTSLPDRNVVEKWSSYQRTCYLEGCICPNLRHGDDKDDGLVSVSIPLRFIIWSAEMFDSEQTNPRLQSRVISYFDQRLLRGSLLYLAHQ